MMVKAEPVLSFNDFREASLEPFLYTVIEMVFLVVPSWAVTNKLITVGLVVIAIACEAVPDTTAVPFTLTVALASLVVGVTVSEVVVDVTDAE